MIFLNFKALIWFPHLKLHMKFKRIEIYHCIKYNFVQENSINPFKNYRIILWTFGSSFSMVLHEWFHNFHMFLLMLVDFNWSWKFKIILTYGSREQAYLGLVLFLFSKFWICCTIRMGDHTYTLIADISRYGSQLFNDTPTFVPSWPVMILQPSKL